MSSAVLFLKASLRNRSFLFWMVLFPALLMLIFGALYGGGGEEQKAPVFLYARGELGDVLREALNGTFDLRVVEEVRDPTAFVLNATARLRTPATLGVVNGTVVAVYSASGIWGPVVRGAVEGALYYAFYPNLNLPVNITLKVLGDGGSSTPLAMGPAIVATVLVLVEAMGAGITGTLGILSSVVSTGLNKRAAISKIGRLRLALAAVAATLLSSFVGIFAILSVAEAVHRVDVFMLVATWQLWASYMLNFLFFAGLALLLTNVVVMRKAEANTMMLVAVLLYLTFAFLTGYFIPIEVMPRDLANFALSTPTSYTAAFARSAVLGGMPPLDMLYYPATASLAVFLLGLYFFKPYSKP